MTIGKNSIIRNISGLMILLILLCSLLRCDLPVTDNKGNIENKEYNVKLRIEYYPGTEIILLEPFSLFCTRIIAHSPDAAIGSFDITLHYDSTIIQYESSYGLDTFITTEESPDMLNVRSSGSCSIGPGENLELCTITWKAVLTSYTYMSVAMNEILTVDGVPFEPAGTYSSTFKIVKRLGFLTFSRPGTMQEETHFSNTLFIDSEDKLIKEYDIDISFDPKKVSYDTTEGNNGVIIGADGFLDDIYIGYNRIYIKGFNENGIGPGTDLEFLTFNWITVDSGRTSISCRVNKMVTLDDVYIKPGTRSSVFSIIPDSNQPAVYVWLEPDTINAAIDDFFNTSILIDTATFKIAAYGIEIFYDPAVVELDTTMGGGTGIVEGEDGFIAAVNIETPGIINIAGMDVTGKGPSPRLDLLRIYWKAIGTSESSLIELDVNNLYTERGVAILNIESSNCTVTVTE